MHPPRFLGQDRCVCFDQLVNISLLVAVMILHCNAHFYAPLKTSHHHGGCEMFHHLQRQRFIPLPAVILAGWKDGRVTTIIDDGGLYSTIPT